jgi:hypothetical protein
MGTGTSIVVFAVGAVLRFAVTATATGFNIHTVGVILMIVGAVGFVVSMAFWGTRSGGGGWAVFPSRVRRTTTSSGGATSPSGTLVTRVDDEVA